MRTSACPACNVTKNVDVRQLGTQMLASRKQSMTTLALEGCQSMEVSFSILSGHLIFALALRSIRKRNRRHKSLILVKQFCQTLYAIIYGIVPPGSHNYGLNRYLKLIIVQFSVQMNVLLANAVCNITRQVNSVSVALEFSS